MLYACRGLGIVKVAYVNAKTVLHPNDYVWAVPLSLHLIPGAWLVQTPPPLYWIFNSYTTYQFRYRLLNLHIGYWTHTQHISSGTNSSTYKLDIQLLHNIAVQVPVLALHLYTGYSTPTQHSCSGTDSSTFILDIQLLHNIAVQVQTHPPLYWILQ